jgi:hypothetical protein
MVGCQKNSNDAESTSTSTSPTTSATSTSPPASPIVIPIERRIDNQIVASNPDVHLQVSREAFCFEASATSGKFIPIKPQKGAKYDCKLTFQVPSSDNHPENNFSGVAWITFMNDTDAFSMGYDMISISANGTVAKHLRGDFPSVA